MLSFKSYTNTDIDEPLIEREFSAEHRRKLATARRGKTMPSSVRKKISNKMDGKSNFEGQKHTSKGKQNISDGRGHYDPIKGKKWYVNKHSGKTWRKERNPTETLYQHGRTVRKGKGLPESFMYFIEGRDADLYHGTSIESVHSILKDGHIKASSDNNHVSLSRSESHAREHSMGEAYFKINQRSLSHTHKITPTDWHMGGSIKGSERDDDVWRDKESRRSESEEAVRGNIPLKHVHTLVINKREHDKMSPQKKEELNGHLKRHGIKLERKDFKGLDENFLDGRNPQDKGDSRRHGIPKKASIALLKKIRSSKTASPRKKQLAHWQINMRSEAYYPGNIGAMELVKFHQKASQEEKARLKQHLANRDKPKALELIQKVSGMKLHPSI